MKISDAEEAGLPAVIVQVDPMDAHRAMQESALMFDVREHVELAAGTPVGAVHLPLSTVEMKIAEQVLDLTRPILLVCQSGVRSALAAQALKNMGYNNVASVKGGFNAWKSSGLQVQIPTDVASPAVIRYSRQLILPGVGEAGQNKLREARVLLVGVGGLGSPAALYLAAAGVGHLRIVDGDEVELSNLHRQIIHGTSGLGMAKVDSAKQRLHELNSDCDVEAIHSQLSAVNAAQLVSDCCVVMDGSDNFATRYLLNDACSVAKIPLVFAAISKFEGQVSTFDLRDKHAPCYRCLFPQAPPPEWAPNCAQAGVLGVLPGMVGTIQATEVLKLILGLGESLSGRVLHVDAAAMKFRELRLVRDPACSACAQRFS
jgi:sulfur-carrier protein adenylyltransferase/sulfurtransferase